MKKLLIFLGALALQAQTVSLSDTLTNAVGGGSFTGRITVTLNAPGSASPLYYSTTSLTGWQAVYCLGVTGSDCTTTTAAGVFAATLYANSTITPAGTSYSARFTPAKGSPWSEVWVITPSTTTLRQVRSSTVPTPTTTFQASQIVPGSNGQVLTTTAGASAWGSVPACATCVVTSGSYADPAWLTSLAGSKVSGNIAGNAATATALQTARTIAGVSFNGTANISIPSTGLSDTANIVRNNAANTYTAGSKQTFAHSATTAGLNVGVQAAAPSSPAQGDVFFNSTLTRKGVYDGTQWRYELYAPSSGTGVVSWDGTSLSASTTLSGLASVTSTSFTGALTGNASTATALSSNLTSTRVLFGQGTGVPATSSYLSWTDQTSSYPTGVLTIGSGTQAFQIAGRGTDSGVSQGVPYLRSATANTPTAFDIMPSGNPAATPSGTVWMDLCSNDLQPLNSDSWNCAIMGISGYVFHSNNGSLVSYVDSGSTGTFTTLNPHQLSAGNSVVVSGGPTGLAGTYTIGSTPTSTTFTITSTGVADGTYTTSPSMVVSTTGSILIGAHNTSGTAGSTTNLAGTSIFFADKIGGTTRAQLTASKLGLGATESIAWYFNTKSQRMASDFNVRWSSTSSPDGTEDVNISRYAANVLAVGTGAQGNASGTLRAATVIADLTGNASTATALASTVASGRLWIGQGTGVPTSSGNLFWDISNNRLGIGTATAGYDLEVYRASSSNWRINVAGDAGQSLGVLMSPGSDRYGIYGNSSGLGVQLGSATIGTNTAIWIDKTSRNVAIGTTTDLGYGLHAANRGTNGNLLVFDPTATTGTTKAVFAAGQGQSGNILEVRGYNATPGSGSKILSISTTNLFLGEQVASTTFDMGNNARIRMAADGTTWDTSLSRASAGVLQVGDGGANSNGYLSAARIGVGTASPAALFQAYVSATRYFAFNNNIATIRSDNNTSPPTINLENQAGSGMAVIDFYTYSGQTTPTLRWQGLDETNFTGSHYFYTATGGSANQPLVERLRVGSTVLVSNATLETTAASTSAPVWSMVVRNSNNGGTTGYGAGLKLKNSSESGVEANKWAGIAAIATATFSNDTAMAFYSASGTASAPTEKMRLLGNGNLLIGTTTDGNYKLEVANSGSSGTARFYDATATTGSTKVVVRAGAGQSGNILEVQNSAGSVINAVNATGGGSFAGSYVMATGAVAMDSGLQNSGTGLKLGSGSGVFWNSVAAVSSSNPDLSLSRSAANTLQVGDGGANANGKIAAGVGLFGGASDDGSSKLQVTGHLIVNAGNALRLQNAAANQYASMSLNASAVVTLNYPMSVGPSSALTSGVTFGVHDGTSTTGSTKLVIRAGAGQSTTNLTEWQNNAGTVLASVTSAGAIASSGSIGINDTGYALTVTGSAGNYVKGLSLPTGSMIGFTGNSLWYSSLDLAVSRSAAGILEINNGTAGTYRDLIARIHTWTNGTEATCSSTTRGQVVMVQGGAGVADTLRVCRKDAADAYAWTALY